MKQKRILLLLFSFSILSILFTKDSFAKKILPKLSKSVNLSKPSSGSLKGVTASVKFRSDRRAIVVSFSNLKIARRVDYLLNYQSKGLTQGASGSISLPTSEPVIRELLFGSCSRGVCRYDTGITNAKLTVTTTLTNGRKVAKNFRLKI